jgi:putative transcriptional regulator
MQYLSGNFLIAEPDLLDPNFFRTVILVIQHSSEGAFGLVVNRQSEVTVGEVLEEVLGNPVADLPVYVGGPVQQSYVFTLHKDVPKQYHSDHAEEVCDRIYFEPSFRHVVAYMQSEDHRAPLPDQTPEIRVFAGYSGWSSGQLEQELRETAWVVNQAASNVIFQEDPAVGWKQALSAKSDFYRVVAETGIKPSLN